MKGDQVFPSNGFDGSFRAENTRKMLFAADKPVPFPAFNLLRSVVAPLNSLQLLAFKKLQTVLLESRIAKHFEKQFQGFVAILRHEIDGCASRGSSYAAGDFRCQEIRLFIELFRLIARSSSSAKLACHGCGQPSLPAGSR